MAEENNEITDNGEHEPTAFEPAAPEPAAAVEPAPVPAKTPFTVVFDTRETKLAAYKADASQWYSTSSIPTTTLPGDKLVDEDDSRAFDLRSTKPTSISERILTTGQLSSTSEHGASGYSYPSRAYNTVGGKTSHSFLTIMKTIQLEKRLSSKRLASGTPLLSKMSSRPLSNRGGDLAAATAAATSPPGESTGLLASTPKGLGEDPTTPADGEVDGEVLVSESVKEYLIQCIFGKGFISLMLLAAPFAIAAKQFEWGDTWVFWLNFFVMIPLASILGDFTEELALHTNQTIGGLINATFGNAVELVVAIQALLANEIRVVQSSMLGSIFSNLLLVLGGCCFFGGLYYKEQSFNSTAATANMGLLALSGIALTLPTPFAEYYELHDEHVLLISRFAAVFLIFMYAQLLVFQLKTHADVFDDGDDDEAELAVLPFWMASLGLLVCTILVTIFSEFLVDSIDGFTESSGISRTFVGIILLPIVGNAVEHVTAITMAMKNKMDLAMGVAVGSCTQISLFVVPLTVLVGWATNKDMTLNFPHFEIILFILSVFTVSVVLGNPTSNWLEGSLLMTTYALIATGFWFENVEVYRK